MGSAHFYETLSALSKESSDTYGLQHAQAAAHPEEVTIPAVHPVNVLLFGDSIDYRVARHLCNVSKHEELLDNFTDDPIGQEHNMTGLSPVFDGHPELEVSFSQKGAGGRHGGHGIYLGDTCS